MALESGRQSFVDALSKVPPAEANSTLKVGDKVRWVNGYGVEWEHTITGFDKEMDTSGFIYFDTDAYWFPHKPDCILEVL